MSIGAGLSGLSAAVELAAAGRSVAVYEAAKFAGGRCRTYYDSVIDLEIDNGNHLLLSGNWAALAYLRKIGGLAAMTEAAEAAFPFVDLKTGERWTLRPNEGRLPWWILDSRRRVPGTRVPDYLAPIGVLRARRDATVGNAMACRGPLYERLWRPVLLAALEHRAGRGRCAARRADPARDARRGRPGLPPDGRDRRALRRLHRPGARLPSRPRQQR